MLQTLFENLTGTTAAILSSMRMIDFIDIAVVAFAIYKIIEYIQGTRAKQIVNGLLILIVAMVVADAAGLHTIYFMDCGMV